MFTDIICSLSRCQEKQFLINVYTIKTSYSVCSVPLILKCVCILHKDENKHSAMAELTGLVKYSLKGFKYLLTLPNMLMYISDLFIASVIVRMLVVVFVTAQVKGTVLMASGIIER